MSKTFMNEHMQVMVIDGREFPEYQNTRIDSMFRELCVSAVNQALDQAHMGERPRAFDIACGFGEKFGEMVQDADYLEISGPTVQWVRCYEIERETK